MPNELHPPPGLALPRDACVRTVLVLAVGDLTKTRLVPALLQLTSEGMLDRIALLDVFAQAPLDLSQLPRPPQGWEYLQVIDDVLPMRELRQRGLVGPGILAVVATPSRFHAPYARQLAECGCRVGVEKPLATSSVEARSLLPYREVHPIDHVLWKAAMRTVLQAIKR